VFVKTAHKDWLNHEILYFTDDITEIFGNAPEFNSSSTVIVESNQKMLEILKLLGFKAVTMLLLNTRMMKQDIEKNPDIVKDLENSSIKYYPKLQDIDWKIHGVEHDIVWPVPEYFLKLDSKPRNDEYAAWQNVVKLEKPIDLASEIIHGFGRGSRSLGIPTANLDITSEIGDKINPLLTGIYYGYACFIPPPDGKEKENINYNKTYKMVMSLGFNPYFENKSKTAEVHLIDEFSGDFYGETLKIRVKAFIRNEADFLFFENLIAAIHNDVQLVKDKLS